MGAQLSSMAVCPICHDFDGSTLSVENKPQAWHDTQSSGDHGENTDNRNFHFRADTKGLRLMVERGCRNCLLLLNGILTLQRHWRDIDERNLHLFVKYHLQNGLRITLMVGVESEEPSTHLVMEFFIIEGEKS